MSMKKRVDATAKKLREKVEQEITDMFRDFTDDELTAIIKGDQELIQRMVDLGAEELVNKRLALITPAEIAKEQRELEETVKSFEKSDIQSSLNGVGITAVTTAVNGSGNGRNIVITGSITNDNGREARLESGNSQSRRGMRNVKKENG